MLERFKFAAGVIHQRIRLDQERVTEDVGKILEIIDQNLYDPDFKISSVKISKATRANFQQQLDATPNLYIRVRRASGTRSSCSTTPTRRSPTSPSRWAIPKSSEALRAAQLELLRGPIHIRPVDGEDMRTQDGESQEFDASAPYYWAAFQIYGDWR